MRVSVDGPAQGKQRAAEPLGPGLRHIAREVGFEGRIKRRWPAPCEDLTGRLGRT